MATPTNYCIALQPICDADMRHAADELLYRASSSSVSADVFDDQSVTARVCNVAFYETGVKSLVGERKIFVNMPYEWLLKPELLPPEPEQIVIEVLESVTGSPEIIASLQQIRAMGFTIALDDFILNEATRPLLDVADIIKVDLLQPFDEQDIQEYKDRGIELLAEKVEDLDTFNKMKDLGFTLFQGYFYAKPDTLKATSRNRSNNHSALLQVLAELQKDYIDPHRLETLIRQDPQLTFLILKYTNSALYRRSREILNIFDAIAVLGLRQVRTIALTIMLANNGPANRLLLVQAFNRAYMCERLASNNLSPDIAFVVGLMSLMDLMLGKPMPDLLAELSLNSEIQEAILGHKHPLGELLKQVELFEQADTADWSETIVDKFNQAYLSSQQQTNKALSAIDAK